MRRRRQTTSFALAVICMMGCTDPAANQIEPLKPQGMTAADKTPPAESQVQLSETLEQTPGDQQGQSPNKPGILDRAADLYNKSKKAAEASDTARKWLTDKYQDASESGGQTAEETATWVNEMYKSLKGQGLTTAADAGQWLSDDIRNMNAWTYKVVPISIDEPQEAEQQMNELGKEGWECFHVSQQVAGPVFFFKKSRKSYLKNMPVKDMLRLIPLMGGEDQ